MKKGLFKYTNKKALIVIVIAIVLNVSMLFTYALYRKTLTGNGTLDSATWTVNQTGANSIALTGGGEEEYTITVTSSSEIDLKYSIELTNIPNGIQVKLDCGDYVTIANNQITFTDVGRLLYTGSTVSRNHKVTFKTPINQSEVASQNVNVKVNFIQDLCSGASCDPEINPNYECVQTYYAFGDPTTSSPTDYTALNKNVFVAKSGNQKSVCIVKDNTLHCFKNNNFAEEKDHVGEVLSEGMCHMSSNDSTCSDSDFSCSVVSNSIACPTPENCHVYSYGYVSCHDYSTDNECRVSNEDDTVTCS